MTARVDAPATRSPGRATALVAFSACCFGSISIFTLVGTRAGASLATLLFWRYLPAAAVLALVARSAVRVAPRRAAAAFVGGGVGQAIVGALTLSALRWISAAMVAFLFYTYPAWIAILATLRGTERVDRRRAASLVLSFGGIVLMVGAPAAVPVAAWRGIVLALGGALTYALYVPFLHRLEADTSPAVASTYVCAGAGLVFLVVAAVDGSLTARLTPTAWGAAAGLALLCTAVAFIAFLRGLATLGPVRTAIVATVEPFWTALLGAAVLAQPIRGATLAGGALIAAAVLLLHLGPAPSRV